MTTLTEALGRFEDRAPDDIAAIIEWLADGVARDRCHHFDGYYGAAAGLRIARAFVEFGDCPEANELALAQVGVLARYALDSTYWDDARALANAYAVVERAAASTVAQTGTVDWHGLQRHARG